MPATTRPMQRGAKRARRPTPASTRRCDAPATADRSFPWSRARASTAPAPTTAQPARRGPEVPTIPARLPGRTPTGLPRASAVGRKTEQKAAPAQKSDHLVEEGRRRRDVVGDEERNRASGARDHQERFTGFGNRIGNRRRDESWRALFVTRRWRPESQILAISIQPTCMSSAGDYGSSAGRPKRRLVAHRRRQGGNTGSELGNSVARQGPQPDQLERYCSSPSMPRSCARLSCLRRASVQRESDDRLGAEIEARESDRRSEHILQAQRSSPTRLRSRGRDITGLDGAVERLSAQETARLTSSTHAASPSWQRAPV